MLDIKLISKVVQQARLRTIVFEGFFYNQDKHDSYPKFLLNEMIISSLKAQKQGDNLLKSIKKIHDKLSDFSVGNFDKYIDDHIKWFRDEPFDPYVEISGLLNSDSITDLPEKISQYAELLIISESYSERQKDWDTGFDKIFPGLQRYVSGLDEDGNSVMIPVSELPKEAKDKMDINKEIEQIEASHALDKYDEWFANMQSLLESKAAFSEMLKLIK